MVLINGRLAGQTEFDNLPREAIERVEVLPESVALQYGFSENRRVLNFILREHYRAEPVRVTGSGATEGGDQSVAADASLVRLEDEARVRRYRYQVSKSENSTRLAMPWGWPPLRGGLAQGYFEPGYLDPTGRVLALTVRKVF